LIIVFMKQIRIDDKTEAFTNPVSQVYTAKASKIKRQAISKKRVGVTVSMNTGRMGIHLKERSDLEPAYKPVILVRRGNMKNGSSAEQEKQAE